MMGGFIGGGGLGFMDGFGWFWVLIWTLNSVLVSMVLVLLIEKLSKKK